MQMSVSLGAWWILSAFGRSWSSERRHLCIFSGSLLLHPRGAQIRSNSATNKKKPSFDLQELLLAEDSYPWTDSTPLKTSQTPDDNEICSGDWIDKVMVNKHESSISHWDGNGETTLPDFFYQKKHDSDSRAYLDQQYRSGHLRNDSHEFEIQRHRLDPLITDESDDLDMATSDSSEADALWQFNLPKAICTRNSGGGGGSKIKKPLIKSMNSPDFRSPNHAHIPSPSRKISSGTTRISRQSSSVGMDGKKTSSSGGKLSSGK